MAARKRKTNSAADEPARKELETAKEELQSLNEELNAVNAQLRDKVEELETANNDRKRREEQLRLLQDVAVAANESETVEAAMRYTLHRVCAYNSWRLGHVLQAIHTPVGMELVPTDMWHVRGGRRLNRFRQATVRTRPGPGAGLTGQVLETRSVRWLRDVNEVDGFPQREAAGREGLHGAIAFPVLIGRELTHVLEFFASEPVEPEPGLLEVMAGVGAQLGRVVERHRLQAQLSEAVWLEQRHLGQELHDTVGQELAGLSLIGKSLADRLRTQQSPDLERAEQLAEGLQTALGQVRNLAQGLFPAKVDEAGLAAALTHMVERTCQRHALDCTFDGDDAPPVWDRQAVAHLFYIAREAVTNAVKHARAKHIRVQLGGAEGRLRLVVQDDGMGLPASAEEERRHGMGLRIMRHRAALIGATLEVGLVEGGGTVVRCTLRQEESDEYTGEGDTD